MLPRGYPFRVTGKESAGCELRREIALRARADRPPGPERPEGPYCTSDYRTPRRSDPLHQAGEQPSHHEVHDGRETVVEHRVPLGARGVEQTLEPGGEMP